MLTIPHDAIWRHPTDKDSCHLTKERRQGLEILQTQLLDLVAVMTTHALRQGAVDEALAKNFDLEGCKTRENGRHHLPRLGKFKTVLESP